MVMVLASVPMLSKVQVFPETVHPSVEKSGAQFALRGVAVIVTWEFALMMTDVGQLAPMVHVTEPADVVALTLFAPATPPLLLAESVNVSVAVVTVILCVEEIVAPELSVTSALML